jgi:exopolysaccharide biosynthesis polyprenyl glycosylphosphotransferase
MLIGDMENKSFKISLFILDSIFIFVSFYLSLLLNNFRYSLIENYSYVIFIYFITMFFYIYFDFYRFKSLKFVKRYLFFNIFISVIAFGLVTLIIFITPYGDKIVFINIFKYYFLVYLFIFLVLRVGLFNLIFNSINRNKRFNKNAVIVGLNENCTAFYKLKENVRLNSGLDIIGFINPGRRPGKKFLKEDHCILGTFSDIKKLSKKYNFRDIFIINTNKSVSSIVDKINDLKEKNFLIHLIEKKFGVLVDIGEFDVYGTEDKFVDFGHKNFYYLKYFKIFFDYLFSIIILIIISPVLLFLMLLIKLTSRGPVFFISKRIGFNKKEFNFLKFRSMKHDVQENIRVHKESIKSFYNNQRNGDIKINISNKRVTSVGKFLRKFSLDELPQFVNVLKQDMSVIGPRPCMDYEFDYFTGWRSFRFLMKPGITGLWQAYGRSKVDFEQLSILEYYYYLNCSFRLDLKILLDTIKVLFLGIGGY